jgi:hypothetical protein
MDETFADKYLDGERYTFVIERDGESYSLSVTGKFHHGGQTTYHARRRFDESPSIWHYNQTAGEYLPPQHDQVKTYGQTTFHTWPAGSAYPDYFFFGDPHINFYEGSAQFDDLRLYLPE